MWQHCVVISILTLTLTPNTALTLCYVVDYGPRERSYAVFGGASLAQPFRIAFRLRRPTLCAHRLYRKQHNTHLYVAGWLLALSLYGKLSIIRQCLSSFIIARTRFAHQHPHTYIQQDFVYIHNHTNNNPFVNK